MLHLGTYPSPVSITVFTMASEVLRLYEAEDRGQPTLAYARRALLHRHDHARVALGIPSVFDPEPQERNLQSCPVSRSTLAS